MTSFASLETSRTLGAPVALYLFTYGPNSGNVYGYTTAEDAITTAGITYQPLAIYNQDFVASGSLDKATLEVSVPKNLPIVQMFSPYPPSFVVTLQIMAGHVGASDYETFWSGRVLSVRTGIDKGTDNQDDAVFSCEPIATSMGRAGLRGSYSIGCPLVLYGLACGASQSAATVTPIVSANENPFIELPGGWNGSFAQNLFPGGLATWTDAAGVIQVRTIIRVTSSTEIQLAGDCSTLTAGTHVALAKGCDHLMTGCTDHANINNYGGQPWIPEVNPLGITNNFT